MSNTHILDGVLNGMPRSGLYRAEAFPGVFPDEKPMLIHQWSDQDREMYCGGKFTKGAA